MYELIAALDGLRRNQANLDGHEYAVRRWNFPPKEDLDRARREQAERKAKAIAAGLDWDEPDLAEGRGWDRASYIAGLAMHGHLGDDWETQQEIVAAWREQRSLRKMTPFEWAVAEAAFTAFRDAPRHIVEDWSEELKFRRLFRVVYGLGGLSEEQERAMRAAHSAAIAHARERARLEDDRDRGTTRLRSLVRKIRGALPSLRAYVIGGDIAFGELAGTIGQLLDEIELALGTSKTIRPTAMSLLEPLARRVGAVHDQVSTVERWEVDPDPDPRDQYRPTGFPEIDVRRAIARKLGKRKPYDPRSWRRIKTVALGRVGSQGRHARVTAADIEAMHDAVLDRDRIEKLTRRERVAAGLAEFF